MKKKTTISKAAKKKNSKSPSKGKAKILAKRIIKKAAPKKLALVEARRQVWCATERKSFGMFPLGQAEIEKQNHINHDHIMINHLRDFPNHDVVLRGRQNS